MALTPEDLELLGSFIDKKIIAAQDANPVNRVSQVGKPDVDPEAGPKYYVHLSNGQVIESFDSTSTHMPGDDGSTQLVIGRYAMGDPQ